MILSSVLTAPIGAVVPPPFPEVVATNTSSEDNQVMSHTVALPAGIQAGNLLLMLFGAFSTASMSNPSGWTSLINQEGSGTEPVGLRVSFKIANGGEGASVNVTTGFNTVTAHNTYRIFNALTAEAASDANQSGVSGSGDPPNLAPSWGPKYTLWIAGVVKRAPASFISTPANFTDLIQADVPGFGGIRLGSMRRELLAASLNPGNFTFINAGWRSGTIGIRPVR